MPGIFGCVKNNKNSNNLKKMKNILNYDSNFVNDEIFNDDYFQAGHIHLGIIKSDKKMFFKDGIYISVEGECYGKQKLKFEKLLFNAYCQNKLKVFIKELDGYYSAIIYDSKLKKIFLISDRYGLRMLYFFYKNDMFAYSSEIKGLLVLPFIDKSLNENQINTFISFGYLLEDNTWFNNIKLIKPATILEYDIIEKKMLQEYYWKWSEIKQQKINFNSAIEQLGVLWLNSIKKRFNPNEKLGISLSGGLDSRAILAGINKLYPDYEGYAYTFGIKNCNDIKIAKECIKKTKWKHEIFIFSKKNWFKKRLNNIWYTDGLLNMMHMHGSEYLDEINLNIDYNLNGFLGDVICGCSYLNNNYLLNKKIDKDIAKKFYDRYSSLKSIEDDFFDLPHLDPFLIMNRGRRFVNMGIVNTLYKVDQRLPFLDNNIIEFLYSIPDEYRYNNKIYSKMLLKFFPEFYKKIPWQKTGYSIFEPKKNKHLYSLEEKITVNIIKKIFNIKKINDYVNYSDWIKKPEVLSSIIFYLIKENENKINILPHKFINSFLLSHLEGRFNYSNEILSAVTIKIYENLICKNLKISNI